MAKVEAVPFYRFQFWLPLPQTFAASIFRFRFHVLEGNLRKTLATVAKPGGRAGL